ncbi:MAG: hypothetical protein JXO22_07675 [Phycisphaerae bacterium]|nr:hypothetical protein [Phycisphaerae bacterium]
MPRTRRPTIGPPHPRMVASFALMPISIAVLPLWTLLCDLVMDDLQIDYNWQPFLMGFGGIALFYGGILCIWWRTFTWTPRGKNLLGTIVLAALFLVSIGLPALTIDVSELTVMALLAATAVGGGVVVVAVSRACWSEPGYGMGLSVPCPGCGADLSGSRSCHCPSCERDYSLEQLVESTRVADAVGITQHSDEQPS